MPLQLSKMILQTKINTTDWSCKTNINYQKTIRPSKIENTKSTKHIVVHNQNWQKQRIILLEKIWIKPVILSIFIRMALTWDKLHWTRRQHEINQWLLQNWNCHPYASYKLPLGQKSQQRYRPHLGENNQIKYIQSTNNLLARRANTGTGQIIQTLSYQKETMESKLKLDLNAGQNLMNSVIQRIQKNTFMNETLIKKINKKNWRY